MNSDLTKEQTKTLLLKAQNDFDLSPVQMAVILNGNKKGYGTYKKWIGSGDELRKPTKSVLAHLTTLYDEYKKSPWDFKKYFKERVNNA